MANHSLPTLTSTYTNFVAELDGRLDDLAVGMDPAVTTVTNPTTNSIRWRGAVNKWEKWNGSAWVDLSSGYDIDISGSTINNTSVGATTASTGAFTTLTSNSTTTLNGTSIPASSTLVTTTSTQTLTNKTLTAPRIGTSILDTNGNELFLLTATASAVNQITYNNAATTLSPTFTATGGDTNISINLVPKGTGAIGINKASTTSGYQLHVGGSALIDSNLRVEGTQIRVAGASSASSPAIQPGNDADTGIFHIATNKLGFSTAATQRMLIDESGNTIIGEGSPTALLDVVGTSTTAVVNIKSTGAGASSFDGSGAGLQLLSAGMNTSSKYTPAIKFGSTDAQFTTTNPKFGAAIIADAADTYASDTNGGMGLSFWTAPTSPGTGSGLVERVRIGSNGNVGIGVSNASTALEVNGTVTATTFVGSLSGNATTATDAGNATTATTLQTARTINGTSFNGSANITTANWGTARTLTIGSTGKSVNGSQNVSWTLAEIGAQAAGNYVTTDTTQTITGTKSFLEDIADGTVPTLLKAGRNTTQYVSFFGNVSGNRMESVSTSGNPKDFAIRVTDTVTTGVFGFTRAGDFSATSGYFETNLVLGSNQKYSTVVSTTTATPTNQQHGVSSTTSSVTGLYGWNGSNPYWIFSKAGTGGLGVHTSVADGNFLGIIQFNGSDGTTFNPSAQIRASVDGTTSTGIVPGRLSFSTESAAGNLDERMIIDSSGYVRLTTSSPGIQFNGDTAAANALGDYEEGTWTPVISDATTGGNTATGTFLGTYTKVGRLVTVAMSALNFNTTGMTGTADLIIQGLPFTAITISGTLQYIGAIVISSATVANNPAAMVFDATSYIRIGESIGGASLDYMTVDQFTSTTADIYLTVTYEAA